MGSSSVYVATCWYKILSCICMCRLAYAVYMLEKMKISSGELNHIVLYDIACSYPSTALKGDSVKTVVIKLTFL